MPWLPRAAVTVRVLSVVMTLPNWSSSLTTGWVPKATPTVAILEGCCVTTNWLAAAGLTNWKLDESVVTPATLVVNFRFRTSAML